MTRTAIDARTIMQKRLAEMATADLDTFERHYHPTAKDRPGGEPPACRTPGAEGFHACALWLMALTESPQRCLINFLRWDEVTGPHRLIASGVPPTNFCSCTRERSTHAERWARCRRSVAHWLGSSS